MSHEIAPKRSEKELEASRHYNDRLAELAADSKNQNKSLFDKLFSKVTAMDESHDEALKDDNRLEAFRELDESNLLEELRKQLDEVNIKKMALWDSQPAKELHESQEKLGAIAEKCDRISRKYGVQLGTELWVSSMLPQGSR